MVLSDNEIKAALNCGQLVIDPLPAESRIATTAVDQTLGASAFKTWKPFADPVRGAVDPTVPNFIGELARTQLLDVPRQGGGSVIIEPRQLILAMTRETVKLPKSSRLAARAEGKSSLARIGLAVHVTAPTIHADFEGPIVLEIVNLGVFNIHLIPGMAICQLILEQVHGTPRSDLDSQFQRQQTVVGQPS
jgi:dCTP deaminase